MSVKHYKPATAKEDAAQRKAKKDWDKMTPAQKKRASTMSKPAKAPKKPVSKAKLKSAGASLRKAVNKQKK